MKKLERKIEQLEDEIKNFEHQMTEDGFYDHPDSEKVIQAYENKKKEHHLTMKEWEETYQAALQVSET